MRAARLSELSFLREELRACFTRRGDALFELADVLLCAAGPVKTLVGLSLAPVHRRGPRALHDALNHGRIDTGRLRDTLVRLPLPRAADGRIVLAVDVGPWLRQERTPAPAGRSAAPTDAARASTRWSRAGPTPSSPSDKTPHLGRPAGRDNYRDHPLRHRQRDRLGPSPPQADPPMRLGGLRGRTPDDLRDRDPPRSGPPAQRRRPEAHLAVVVQNRCQRSRCVRCCGRVSGQGSDIGGLHLHRPSEWRLVSPVNTHRPEGTNPAKARHFRRGQADCRRTSPRAGDLGWNLSLCPERVDPPKGLRALMGTSCMGRSPGSCRVLPRRGR